MKTYNKLPQKYAAIKPGEIKVIDSYAYAVTSARYSGERDIVYRISLEEYNDIRQKAQLWEVYLCDPTEENLQQQIWSWMTTVAELDIYCQTTPY